MKFKLGFTLVEVVVVIGIIAVLTVVIFPSVSNLRAKNRDTERIADIAAIQLGLSLYKNQASSTYPVSLSELVPTYTQNDSIIDPEGEQYLYVPLARSGSESKCTYYQLGSLLELPNGQIDITNTFSTLEEGETNNPNFTAALGYKYCTGYSGPGINGIYNSQNNIMYTVHP